MLRYSCVHALKITMKRTASHATVVGFRLMCGTAPAVVQRCRPLLTTLAQTPAQHARALTRASACQWQRWHSGADISHSAIHLSSALVGVHARYVRGHTTPWTLGYSRLLQGWLRTYEAARKDEGSRSGSSARDPNAPSRVLLSALVEVRVLAWWPPSTTVRTAP